MPSPFPGMDPYLENSLDWRDLHNSYLVGLRGVVTSLLPLGYTAHLEESLTRPRSQRRLVPSLTLVHRPISRPEGEPKEDNPAVLKARPSLILEYLDKEEPPFCCLQIYAKRENERQLVTTIELIHRTTKTREDDLEAYREKQAKLLTSKVNLVEIDLLRGGNHAIAAPHKDLLTHHGRWDYCVCLHRGGKRGKRFELWPFSVRDRLPRIPIPLNDTDSDIVVDLQPPFDHNYEAARYALGLDYTRPPETPLSGEDAVWADALLREKQLRK